MFTFESRMLFLSHELYNQIATSLFVCVSCLTLCLYVSKKERKKNEHQHIFSINMGCVFTASYPCPYGYVGGGSLMPIFQ
jgi:hypothetical protein